MKYTALLFFLLLVANENVFAQSPNDTSATRQQQIQERQRTRFIDTDGDGICDERAEGLGFKRSVAKQKHQYGKNQSLEGTKGQGTSSTTPQGKSNQYRRGKQQ